MGKTKTKFIDDSSTEEQTKQSEPKKKVVKDELVEKLKAELGIEETVKAEKPTSEEKETKEVKAEEAKETPKAKTTTKTKAKPRSKKYQEASKDIDRTKVYPLNEAVELAKKGSYTKFDGTIEVHINTAQTNIRGLVTLPHFAGKKIRILAFGPKSEESGADIIGSDETIDEISKGKINFDLVVTHPSWIPKLARVAKFLGPRGLMPNPKNGTITDDLKKAVEGFQAGKTEYRTESKAPVIHLGLGKVSQPTEEVATNIKMLLQTIGKTRIRKVTVSPTMGPSVRVDLSSL